MASVGFLERFKDRTALVGRQGEIETVSSKPVSRAKSSHDSPSRMRSTGQMVLRGESPGHRQSLSFSAKQEQLLVKPSSSVRTSIEFSPYSQQEYEALGSGRSMQLGGLGSQVGSEGWRRQKEVSERRAEYAKLIQEVNSVRLPGSITLQQDRGARKQRGLRKCSRELFTN
jgi:hypothetical protein